MMQPAILSVVLALLAQTDDSSADAAARLVVMKKVLASYDVRSPEMPQTSHHFQADPVLRFTNTVGSTRDGAVFLWLGDHGRPAAAVQFSLRRDGLWFHELSSLCERPLVAESPRGTVWSPMRGGIEFKPLPGVPKPAGTPEQRLRQMRALAAEFTVEDAFRHQDWQKLRMLSKPFARYGEPGSDLIDGALFAYVVTTDPEALLMIEARQAKDGAEWHYAFAPMTIYALRGLRKSDQVWTLPFRDSNGISSNPNEPFYVKKSTIEP
ncbi:MAG: hypothetical protein P4L84_21000 [Isosphaeraceae bacterium]|nr:hypothetical protein [Isosphaeraceae bacterium]